MLLNDKPHPNHTLTTIPNPKPPNTKPLSNQSHTVDDTLVILATKTTLSETQKNVLRKGLTFIPKPKKFEFLYTGYVDLKKDSEGLEDTLKAARLINLPELQLIVENAQKEEEFLNPSIGTWLEWQKQQHCKATLPQ